MSVVQSRREAAVGWVIFNRPNVLNAMNHEVFAEFGRCLDGFAADPDVRIVAVTGAGRAFSAGADITLLADAPNDARERMMQAGHAMMDSVEAFPKPVSAAVNGIAAGGGFELALACDFVFAERRAQFGLTEIRYGFLPGGGGTQRLPGKLSWAAAMDLLCSGDLITAERAAELGIVFRLVGDGEIHAAIQDFASHIALRSAEAVAAAKALMRHAVTAPSKVGLRAEIAANLALMQSETATAAMTAFVSRALRKNLSSKEK